MERSFAITDVTLFTIFLIELYLFFDDKYTRKRVIHLIEFSCIQCSKMNSFSEQSSIHVTTKVDYRKCLNRDFSMC